MNSNVMSFLSQNISNSNITPRLVLLFSYGREKIGVSHEEMWKNRIGTGLKQSDYRDLAHRCPLEKQTPCHCQSKEVNLQILKETLKFLLKKFQLNLINISKERMS